MKQLKLSVIMVMITLIPVLTHALDIPFYLSLHTTNLGMYYPDRVGKTVVWDERYIAGFGIESYTVGAFTSRLDIRGEREGDGFEPRIKTLSIAYGKGAWKLAGMTVEAGFGAGYPHIQRYIMDDGFDTFLFDRGRFNGLEARYLQSGYSAGLRIGGNAHNQAMAGLRQSYRFSGGSISLDARISARDTHWNTPSVLPSISGDYTAGQFSIRADAGINLLPAFENEPYRQEVFAASGISVGSVALLQVHLGGQYSRREFYPFEAWRTNFGLEKQVGKLCIAPALDIRGLDDTRLYELSVLGNWKIVRGFEAGMFYKYGFGDDAEKSHSVGLQSSLRLDM